MTPRGLDSDYTSEKEGSGTIGLFFFACLLGAAQDHSGQAGKKRGLILNKVLTAGIWTVAAVIMEF